MSPLTHFKVAALHTYTLVITMQISLALFGKQKASKERCETGGNEIQ